MHWYGYVHGCDYVLGCGYVRLWHEFQIKELYRQGEGGEVSTLCMMYAYFFVSMCYVSVYIVYRV